MMAFSVGFLITGHEVVSGKTRDTNGHFMAQALRRQGIAVTHWLFCGDDENELLRCLAFLEQSGCGAVIMTGGLGPTSDDLTATTVARYVNQDTRFFPEAWQVCVDYFGRVGRGTPPETNRKQAELPAKSTILPNPNGTAAGFYANKILADNNKVTVFCLPGVPSELEPMFTTSVLPELQKRQGTNAVTRCWQIFALGESVMQARVGAAEEALKKQWPGTHVSYQSHGRYVTYSVSLPCTDAEATAQANHLLDSHWEGQIKDLFGHHILYRSLQSLPEKLIEEAQTSALTLAGAESCTGGLIADFICACPDASKVFLGTEVCYSNESKVRLLQIDRPTLEQHGAVSAVVAAHMSYGALNLFGADVSYAVTGIAGPAGGTPEKPIGLVYAAISFRLNKIKVTEQLLKLGWTPVDPPLAPCGTTNDVGTIGITLNHGRVARRVVQTRVAQFVLGSLVAMVLSGQR